MDETTTRKLANDIVQWMLNYQESSGTCCWIVGVSGGIDSAVACRLAEYTNKNVQAIAMPMYCHGIVDSVNLDNVMTLCVNPHNVKLDIRPIGQIVESYKNNGVGCKRLLKSGQQLREGNLRSRIRANILYDAAHYFHGLVVGTGNKDEDQIGYFTKGGDGLVDLCPLSDLHKSQVYDLARYLNVPDSIINAVPSAGLWDGQTDETELGMTYDEIEWALKHINTTRTDACLNLEELNILNDVKQRVRTNAHKLKVPPVFPYNKDQ